MIMKQKYIMPKAELIEVKANAILAGSNVYNSDNTVNFNKPTMGDGGVEGQGAARSMRFDVWEDIDETNGYK